MRTLGTKLPPNKILSLYQPIFLVSFQWQMTENILTFYVNKSISAILISLLVKSKLFPFQEILYNNSKKNKKYLKI